MATRLPSERRSLRTSLQAAGAEPHARLDASFGVDAGSASGYAALLQLLQSFHSSADPLLTAWAAGSPSAPSVTVPHRAGALTRDLLALGVGTVAPVDVSGLPRDEATGLLTDGAGLGLLYVVAGSSIGARVVLRQLPLSIRVRARAGLGEGAGPLSVQLWRTTLEALAGVASPTVTDDATLTCRLVFDTLAACSGCDRRRARPVSSAPQVLPLPAVGLVAVGDAIDLTNCEREPIRVPGSVQPHGVLLTMADAASPIAQVSANIGDLTGLTPDEVLGTTLDTIFTPGTVSRIGSAMAGAHPQVAATGVQQQIRVRVRLDQTLVAGSEPVDLDGLLHRSGPDWVLEVEPYSALISVGNTYHEVRSVVTALNRTMDTATLYDITVRAIRALTGFDRVMLYRFDRDWNGEVCAEDKRQDLEAFLGLHYPAGDIPPQARALYTVNWLRFIHDVDAVSAPLVPVLQPRTGEPLDLSFASLRSVSPVHCEYLRTMGVTASMSVSLVIDGELVGLIACHHYSGPYVPPPAVRATCEFLAQTLSLLLAAREQVARTDRADLVRQVLAQLEAAALASRRPTATALTEHAPALLEVLGAAGAAWTLDGVTRSHGTVPNHAGLSRVREWGRRHAVDGLATTESLGDTADGLRDLSQVAAGVVVLVVSDDQDVVFFRPETAQTIDWGGNPHLKNLVTDADGTSRLSPRGSFKLWRENVLGRSTPWEPLQLEAAEGLRRYLVQHMLRHARDLAGVAETLARSLLPQWLPEPDGWQLAADSRPAATGIGGDWYDAFVLASGELLLVVGDVAGHGLYAATTMAHLRNALRAYAFEDPCPPRLLARLDRLASAQTDDVLTTVVVALLDPRTGRVQVASAGHPAPLLRRSDGSTDYVALDPRPPLGLGYTTQDEDEGSVVFTMHEGDALVLFSDGVVERRGESIETGLGRLRRLTAAEVGPAADAVSAVRSLVAAAQPERSEDDTTLVLLVRNLVIEL